jgi:hypothetical protein
MSGKRESFASLSVYIDGDDWWTTCHHYDGQTPILVINNGPNSMTVSLKGREASESAVRFARALLASVQEFAADIERLHAERTAPGTDSPAEQAA